MWISPPFAPTAGKFRAVLTLMASVMSAYAQNPPPLSLEQWWKPPPGQENGQGVKSYTLNKSQTLKTLLGFAKRWKWKSEAFTTLFMASLNLYSPTLMAQPLSTASFPALKKNKTTVGIPERNEATLNVCFYPKSLLAFQCAIFTSFATEPDPWIQSLTKLPST